MLNVEDAQTTTREAISFGCFCFESFESFDLLHVNHIPWASFSQWSLPSFEEIDKNMTVLKWNRGWPLARSQTLPPSAGQNWAADVAGSDSWFKRFGGYKSLQVTAGHHGPTDLFLHVWWYRVLYSPNFARVEFAQRPPNRIPNFHRGTTIPHHRLEITGVASVVRKSDACRPSFVWR